MQVWYGAEQVPEALSSPAGPGSVVSIGVFDGVHRGHQAILERVVQRAQQMGARDEAGARPLAVAMTFDPHPRHVHQPDQRFPLVTSLTDRLASLEAVGLDAVLVVPYDLDFAAQGPEDFIRAWLHDLLGARAVVVGHDVRFGRGNSGDARVLERIGARLGIEVEILTEVCSGRGRRWSSTWIRQCLKDGRVREAADVLGRPHRLRGTVVHGLRRGRELGFPTANLEAATAGVVPPDGVYAGWLVRDQGAGAGERLPAAISIGTNPTFDDVPQRTVEAHVLGRADLNLYGEEIGVELVEHLRPMLAFDGLDPLLAQMRTDIQDTARILGVPEPGPIRPEDVTAH
ncbi:bifunctional riboflavin kinase/FAD synthetase [Actinomyces bowdenii]|uniref:Riboflavin biosynthesis protein n=1 Tax=Actinomyces bowdenii TaxID=131109 RepID=A0A853EID4_9ACTO|nr:bifunctional riboflavin kinase/FAD synthetase [Actinomyces bowdenii]MBF0696157.1 bifunctional riboflavin kinase/FAD synthetase [Actinomyces bowdenii]MDO5065039.1 bifunctional riboflavin kinase/FAD synthetase [Actinomyces bowdenii]NYS68330.1 bifunctional riboflavin kinase/FAD synthetase [Actinomyces bowdenii]